MLFIYIYIFQFFPIFSIYFNFVCKANTINTITKNVNMYKLAIANILHMRQLLMIQEKMIHLSQKFSISPSLLPLFLFFSLISLLLYPNNLSFIQQSPFASPCLNSFCISQSPSTKN